MAVQMGFLRCDSIRPCPAGEVRPSAAAGRRLLVLWAIRGPDPAGPGVTLVTPAAGPGCALSCGKRLSVIVARSSGRGSARLAGGRPGARVWAMHGHMADRIGAVPAVRRTACSLVMCLASSVEGSFDLPVGDVVLAVDAVGVDGEQGGDAVPGPPRDLGGGGVGVQPQGQGGMPQVVGAAGESGGDSRGPEGQCAGGVPDAAVAADCLAVPVPLSLSGPPRVPRNSGPSGRQVGCCSSGSGGGAWRPGRATAITRFADGAARP